MKRKKSYSIPIWGQRMYEARKKKGRKETQEELANALSEILKWSDGRTVVRENITQWESGSREPDLSLITALAMHYDCSTDYFLGLTESFSNEKNLRDICDYTGLSDESVHVLNAKKDNPPLLSEFLNSFLTSEALELIIQDLSNARDSNDIARGDKCTTDIQHATAMTNLDTKLGLSASGYQLEGKPDIPPGTVLLEADNAVDYYIDRLTRRFGEFIRKQYFETDKKE